MNSNIVNPVAYLRTSREFPEDIPNLVVEVNKSYLETASAVNDRIIGIFSTNQPAITGENWFFTTQSQQTLRQIYPFGSIAPGVELDIPTNITNFTQFTRIYGTATTANGSSGQPDYRPLPYLDTGGTTGGITILVGIVGGIQQIRIVNGSAAPAITGGIAILEWLSAV